MNMNQFDFDEIVKKKGTKTQGFLDIAAKADGSMIRIPYMVVVGAEEGPVFLGEGGIHGDEVEGAESLAIVARELDPQKLRGVFLAVPHLNLEAFNIGKRAAGNIDYTAADMNRVLPGDAVHGKITCTVAAVYTENFVKKADYIISFHGGGNTLYLEPLCSYCDPKADPEKARLTYEMAKAFGAKVLWRAEQLPFGGSLMTLTDELKIPCICPEIGGNSCAYPLKNTMRQISVNGIYNVLKYLKMIDGEVALLDEYIDVMLDYLHTTHGGIFRAKKTILDKVKKGEVMSEVYNVFGEKIDECVAPYDGVIIGMWTASVIQPRDWTILFGKPVD